MSSPQSTSTKPSYLLALCIGYAWLLSGLAVSETDETGFICPTECDCWYVGDGPPGRRLICSFLTIGPNTNFTAIPAAHTLVLEIYCSSPFLFSEVDEDALRHLVELDELHIIGCKLKEIPAGFLDGLLQLRLLRIISTHLETKVAPGAFRGVPNLLSLNLTASGLSSLPRGELCALPRLLQLLLGGNNLDSWEGTGALENGTVCLPQLAYLNLERNLLASLPDSVLGSSLLHLFMRGNRIRDVRDAALDGLASLQLLDLGENEIRTISDGAFSDAAQLRVLLLDRNQLATLPAGFYELPMVAGVNVSGNSLDDEFLARMQANGIENLDASYNELTMVTRASFNGSSSLQFLSLQGNRIENIEDFAFTEQTNLQVLFLSSNLLGNLTVDVFRGLGKIRHLFLDNNTIGDIQPNAFASMKEIINVNVSRNDLRHLGFASDMVSLIQLDVSHNQITEVSQTDLFQLTNMTYLLMSYCQMKEVEPGAFDKMDLLEKLDLSYNRLTNIRSLFRYATSLQTLMLQNNRINTTLGPSTFPGSIQTIDLESNEISDISPYTFSRKPSLKTVNFRQNRLTTLRSEAIKVSVPSADAQRPAFSIGINDYFCSCDMAYLLTVNAKGSVGHASIRDLNRVYCRTYYNPTPTNWLVDVDKKDFLCPYEEQCVLCSKCDCVGRPLCDCYHVCPTGCECWRDQSWSMTNLVTCSSSGQSEIPVNVSVMVTELRLDGNNVTTIHADDLVRRHQLNALWLNNSGVRPLTEHPLHAYMTSASQRTSPPAAESSGERCELPRLQPSWLCACFGLDAAAFIFSRGITTWLTVMWIDVTPMFSMLALHGNAFSKAPEAIYGIRSSEYTLRDSGRIYVLRIHAGECNKLFSEDLRLLGDLVIEILDFEMVMYCTAPLIRVSPGFIAGFVMLGVLFLTTVLCIALTHHYQHEIKLWLFVKYGVRVFKRKDPESDKAKKYDAFISYHNSDEDIILREFVPQLEHGETPYKLCVHNRDFLAGEFIAENIVYAVENSRRTIVLLTASFIDSEWCRYEFQAAHNQAISEKVNRIILVVFEDIPKGKLDKNLEAYIKTNTYIRYDDPMFWSKLRYALPAVRAEKPLPDDPPPAYEPPTAEMAARVRHDIYLNEIVDRPGVQGSSATDDGNVNQF
ncbi:PREDICTED: uncharacterized protein LOC106807798 [Priapulus caudatus]|uniref:Uncharacterized protein LOC106807798 n=1 Tax=Priapulus caudatus TaxID=37621 RepID=A0ABM1E0L7_PRICU|nr:PREDICTED: uncharacterized protein LOC106807798 [Priapulus caudatus]